MRHPTTALAGLVLAALVAATPAAAQGKGKGKGRGHEPMYDNRPLHEWIADLGAAAPYTRTAAAYAVGSLGAKAKPAVPALIRNLESEDAPVRFSSAIALGEIGPDAAEAVPALRKLLDDRNDDVAHMAKKALVKITGDPVE